MDPNWQKVTCEEIENALSQVENLFEMKEGYMGNVSNKEETVGTAT